MNTPHRMVLVGLVLLSLAGCGLTPSQLQGTAQALGCWPYGYDPPAPTKTIPPLPTAASGTPTAIVTETPTPAPTFTSCTPAPLTPTVTASPTPSPTPWTRPTPLPGIVGNQNPLNLSNQAGIDVDPAIAVHPTDGWAAVVWANWLAEFPNETTVIVKVQDPRSRSWGRGIGVSTGAVEKNAGAPAITIDAAGRIHVAFAQDGRPTYTRSDDDGATWTTPEVIPGARSGGLFFQLTVDAAQQLHVLYATSPGDDQYTFVHAQRPADGAGGWIWQGPITDGAKLLYGDLTTVQLPGGQIRTVVVVGCRVGCAVGPIVATQDGPGGPWVARSIPDVDIRVSPQVVAWVDVIALDAGDTPPEICIAWGQYSRSALHTSCSTDRGDTWRSPEIIAYHDGAPVNPPPATAGPTPAASTPGPSDDDTPDGDDTDRGFHPELVYVPSSDRLMAIWVFRERRPASGAANPSYLVYSWRDRTATHWTPLIDGGTQEPPLRLVGDTRRSAARTPRVAGTPDGQAWVTWIEVAQDETIDVYVAPFTPSALVNGGS